MQYDSRMGYWKGKGESKRFVPLTNFAMKFIKFVRSPEQLPDYAGFIVKVTQPSGKRITEGSVSMHYCLYSCSILTLLSMVICYSDRVSCHGIYHISNSDQLRATLGAAMPDSVLSCQMSPSQIKEMLMQKWEKLL